MLLRFLVGILKGAALLFDHVILSGRLHPAGPHAGELSCGRKANLLDTLKGITFMFALVKDRRAISSRIRTV